MSRTVSGLTAIRVILDYSVLDLKADCRGYKYVEETIKLLPEKPEPVLFARFSTGSLAWVVFMPLNPPSAFRNWRRYWLIQAFILREGLCMCHTE